MIDDASRNQASDYVLGLLIGDDLIAFEARLTGDAELRELVDEYRSAAALLAYSVDPVTPPPALRNKVLAAILEQPSEAETPAISVLPPPTQATTPSRPPTKASVLIGWSLAAGFAIFAGILWSNNQSLMNDSRELATQKTISEDLFKQLATTRAELRTAAEANHASEQLIATLEAELPPLRQRVPELEAQLADLQKRNAIAEMRVATLTSQIDASYLASIAWDQDEQTGVLHVRRLPEAETGKDYQLWVLDKNQTAPVSAGVFRVQPDGSATLVFSPTQPVSPDTSFAVSLEQAGGAPAPAGPIVLSN